MSTSTRMSSSFGLRHSTAVRSDHSCFVIFPPLASDFCPLTSDLSVLVAPLPHHAYNWQPNERTTWHFPRHLCLSRRAPDPRFFLLSSAFPSALTQVLLLSHDQPAAQCPNSPAGYSRGLPPFQSYPAHPYRGCQCRAYSAQSRSHPQDYSGPV